MRIGPAGEGTAVGLAGGVAALAPARRTAEEARAAAVATTARPRRRLWFIGVSGYRVGKAGASVKRRPGVARSRTVAKIRSQSREDIMDGMNFFESLFRWGHIVAGVLWIGLLWFFNFVNSNFAPTMDADTKKKVIPELMPRALWAFRTLEAASCQLGDGTPYAPYRLDLPVRGQIKLAVSGTAGVFSLTLRDAAGIRVDSGASQ